MFFFLLPLTCARRRGRGLLFFINFFFILEWLGRGVKVFFSFDMLKGDGRGTRLIFDRSFLSSSFVLVNPFCIPCQGHLVATVECKKYPCGCLSHPPRHVLRLCFLPLCTARCHRTGRCTFLVLNMASSVRISSKPRMIPVSSLNGMEAFSRQNMLANTIEFCSVCSVLGKTMLTRFYFFLPRFFLGFSFSESSLFFVSLVLSFFRRLLGGPH